MQSDALVLGGGLVGAATAYGLAREGLKVTVLDEGDVAFRASRGNFGLPVLHPPIACRGGAVAGTPRCRAE